MRNTWAVCKREFAGFFLTPIGYVVVGMVALIAGLAFSISFIYYLQLTPSPASLPLRSVPHF